MQPNLIEKKAAFFIIDILLTRKQNGDTIDMFLRKQKSKRRNTNYE